MDVFHVQNGTRETKLALVRNLCHENEFLSPTFMKEAWRALSTQQKLTLEVRFADNFCYDLL